MNSIQFYIKNYSLPILLAGLPICAVFLSEKFIPYIAALIIIFFLFEENKIKNFKNSYTILVPFICYISVYIIYALLSDDIKYALKFLERQTLILLMPMLIFSSNLNKQKEIYFFKFYVFTLLGISVFSLFKLIWFLNEYKDWIQTMNSIKGNFTYIQFKYPHLLGVHPTYWGYLIVLANIFLLNNNSLNIFKNKYVPLVFLVLLNINLLYLSARTPIFINIIVHFFSLALHLKNNIIGIKKALVLILSFIVIILVFFFQPLLSFKIFSVFDDERFFLWPKAIELIKDNYFLLGEGLGQGNVALKTHLFDIYDIRKNYDGFDLHNQYLKAYLDMGILGFLSLIYLIIYPLLISVKQKKNFLLNLSFTILFLLCIMTESTLYVIKGIVIFAVFSSILLKRTN